MSDWLGSVVSLEGVFGAASAVQDARAGLARSAMSRGATALQNGDYEAAAQEFKRATGLDPQNVQTWQLLGKTYQYLGRSEDAIDAFEQAVRVDPTDSDSYADLASAAVGAKQYETAEKAYRAMLSIDRSAPSTYEALGYLYMLTERYGEAETQFQKVVSLAPRDAGSYYNLGVVYNRQGRHGEARQQLETALSLDSRHADARAELAYAYIGLGQGDLAQREADTLWSLNSSTADLLAAEIEATLFTPKMTAADIGASTFNPFYHAGTPVSWLDSSLATPGASATLSLVITFNQDMDVASVQNIANWLISRATGGEGGVYNYGVSLNEDKEAKVSPLPLAVRYDPTTHQATVYFKVRQNETGDAIIDPSHLVFKFSGKDVSGNPMDKAGDQFDGFRISPF